MKQKRIEWIDGLKGLACIFIIFHHFLMGYYPAAYSGDYAYSHMASGADVAFAQSPLAFFTIGDFWVSIFCLISGFIIANQVWKMTEDKQFSKALLKRYPRLMLPVLCISIFVFIMLQVGLFYNSQAAALTRSEWLDMFYHDKSGVIELLTDSLIDDWFVGMRLIYSNAFWMLKDLFMGSFVAYILAAMGKEKKKRMFVVYLFVSLIYLSINSRMADFALGVLAAFLFAQLGQIFGPVKEKEKSNNRSWPVIMIGILLLVIGFLLGAYPVECIPTNGYRYLLPIQNFLYGRLTPYLFYHKLAAFSLVLGIGMLSQVQKILGSKVCCFLGKISYAVYLIHIPVLFSLTAVLFVKINASTGRYNLAAGVALVISLAVIILLSWLFQKYIEKYCEKATNWFVNWILK